MRYMRKIGTNMIFPYDPNPNVLAECELLPEGFDPITKTIKKEEVKEVVRETVREIAKEETKPDTKIKDVKVPEPPEVEEPLFTVDSVDMFIDTTPNYSNLRRSQAMNEAKTRSIPTSVTETRDDIIAKLVEDDKSKQDKGKTKNI